jgi:hypothetical protein
MFPKSKTIQSGEEGTNGMDRVIWEIPKKIEIQGDRRWMRKWNMADSSFGMIFSKLKNRTFLIVFLYFMSLLVLADSHGYNEKKQIVIESDKLIVSHFHDWSDGNKEKRSRVFGLDGLKDPFSSLNDYAYLECRDKKSGSIRFRIPSIALTHIQISPDSRYIVGLSNIKLDNPLQMIVLNSQGEVFFRMHIAPKEAFLTHDEFAKFKTKYPDAYRILDGMNGFSTELDGVYIDYSRMNMPRLLGSAWDFLYGKEAPHHLLGDFGESVTNYIFWYQEPDPEIQFDYNGKNLRSISLMDFSGKIRMEIPLEKKNWDYAGLDSLAKQNKDAVNALFRSELALRNDWLLQNPILARTKASFFNAANSKHVLAFPISWAPNFGMYITDCENSILAEAYSAGKRSFWLLNETGPGNRSGYTSLHPYFPSDLTILTEGSVSSGWLSEWRKGKEKERECPGNHTFPIWRIRSWDFDEAAAQEALHALRTHYGNMIGIVSFNDNFKEEAMKAPRANLLKLETQEGTPIQGTGVDLNGDEIPDLFWHIENLPDITRKYFRLYINVGGEWKCAWVELVEECV